MRTYRCSYCKKSFKRKTECKIHERIHTGEKPYHCNYCDQNFRHQNVLENHIRIHTGEKPYPCQICKKDFRVKSALGRHLKTHSGEKAFKCHECPKRFIDKPNLKRHMLSHFGLWSFQCGSCLKSFKRGDNLNRHKKSCAHANPANVHSKDEEHLQGNTCGVGDLLERENSPLNSEGKPNQCLLCPLSFKLSIGLIQHVRRVHGKKAEVEEADLEQFEELPPPTASIPGSCIEYNEPLFLASGKDGEWTQLTVNLNAGKKYRLVKCPDNPKLVNATLLNAAEQ